MIIMTKKVEINNKSGWIQFDEDNLVSFNDMMELIKENTIYSLKDSQTLRVNKNLDNSQKIFDELNFLYNKLRTTNGES